MDGARQKAIVLLSGGLDSATVMAHVRQAGYEAYALSFAYGQRQLVELEAAGALAKQFGAQEHRVVSLDLGALGGSSLTTDAPVPDASTNAGTDGACTTIPTTYVPARNTIFLSYALAWGEVLGAQNIFIGANAVDYSGYPDCRPAFIAAFEQLANLGTRAADGGPPYRIHAPLMHLKKKDIILMGVALGVDYRATHSCYNPKDGLACRRCDACCLRARGFAEADLPDPTRYAPS